MAREGAYFFLSSQQVLNKVFFAAHGGRWYGLHRQGHDRQENSIRKRQAKRCIISGTYWAKHTIHSQDLLATEP